MVVTRGRPTAARSRRSRWSIVAVLLAAALAAPAHALAADPIRSDPVGTFTGRPARVAESLNLYRSSAMVKQYTSYWCVPATTQSMVNLVRGTSNRTYDTQRFMYRKTRENNRYTYASLGNDPQGWAWAVTYFSRGEASYQARAFDSRSAAIDAIVESLVRTRHPVGVTVQKGTHAWVVLGFKGDVRPGDPSSRRVFGLYVSGPLGSPRDPWAVQYMSLDTFASSFTRYHEWQRPVIWEDKYVIIAD
ncbi:MAG: hypothetical protein ACLGIJ_12150 [Candidatus Limnocylindria bacterium]